MIHLVRPSPAALRSVDPGFDFRIRSSGTLCAIVYRPGEAGEWARVYVEKWIGCGMWTFDSSPGVGIGGC